jgi:hypothetical protein
MRQATIAAILLALLLLAILPVAAQRRLLVSASVSTESVAQGLLVSVTGSVKASSNVPVENAEVSIQVTNPQNSSVFVGLIFSGANGGYSIKFTLPRDAVPGNYSVFISTSKPGYDTAIVRLFFLISNPDFSLLVSPQSADIRQGEEATFTITVVAGGGFASTVNLTLSDFPQGTTFRFSNASLIPPGSSILRLNTTRATPVGTHNITVVGISSGIAHSATVSLQVQQTNDFPPPITTEDNTTLVIAIAAVGAVLISAMAVVIRRRRRPSADLRSLMKEAEVDHGYVATARALARLEELRSLRQIDDQTYNRLRNEFEKRLSKTKL